MCPLLESSQPCNYRGNDALGQTRLGHAVSELSPAHVQRTQRTAAAEILVNSQHQLSDTLVREP